MGEFTIWYLQNGYICKHRFRMQLYISYAINEHQGKLSNQIGKEHIYRIIITALFEP
jgi:hypothetical protein